MRFVPPSIDASQPPAVREMRVDMMHARPAPEFLAGAEYRISIRFPFPVGSSRQFAYFKGAHKPSVVSFAILSKSNNAVAQYYCPSPGSRDCRITFHDRIHRMRMPRTRYRIGIKQMELIILLRVRRGKHPPPPLKPEN